MIKLKVEDQIILGLDKNNIKLLTEGKPIYIDMSVFGIYTNLTITYKDSMSELKDSLEKTIGIQLPELEILKPGEEKDLTQEANNLNKEYYVTVGQDFYNNLNKEYYVTLGQDFYNRYEFNSIVKAINEFQERLKVGPIFGELNIGEQLELCPTHNRTNRVFNVEMENVCFEILEILPSIDYKQLTAKIRPYGPKKDILINCLSNPDQFEYSFPMRGEQLIDNYVQYLKRFITFDFHYNEK